MLNLLVLDTELKISYSYDTLGRKISMDDPDLGRWVYRYDASGNLIEQVGAGGQLITGDGFYREYDDFGQLVRIREGNNASAPLLEAYEYDESGIRVHSTKFYTNNGSIEEEVYVPNREFTQIVNSSGEFNSSYIYLDNTLISRLNPNGSKYFYMPDHLGSTTLILDENGEIVEETFYRPYGEVEANPTKETKVGYTGHEFDEDTGQVYMKARYMKPGQGQFISPDSEILDIFDPQSLNRFAYTRNNPLRYIDPDGRHYIGLQEESGFGGLGHSGGIVYNDEYAIYYSQQATSDLSIIQIFQIGTLQDTELEGGTLYIESSLDELYSKHYKELSKYNKQFAKVTDKAADDRMALKMIELKENTNYNLLCDNCGSRQIEIMNAGGISNFPFLIPNVQYSLTNNNKAVAGYNGAKNFIKNAGYSAYKTAKRKAAYAKRVFNQVMRNIRRAARSSQSQGTSSTSTSSSSSSGSSSSGGGG